MNYQPRTILLDTPKRRKLAIAALEDAPDGIEIELRQPKKQRSLDANAKYWAGPLKDIAEQFWLNNRQYTAEVLHELFKERYLVDENEEPYLHEHVKNPESYHKYDFTPDGKRVLVGSTTQLTPFGFSHFMEQVHAFGAANGVLFTTKEQR